MEEEEEEMIPAPMEIAAVEAPPKPSVVVTKTEDTGRHIQTFLRARPLSETEILAEDQTPFLTVSSSPRLSLTRICLS